MKTTDVSYVAADTAMKFTNTTARTRRSENHAQITTHVRIGAACFVNFQHAKTFRDSNAFPESYHCTQLSAAISLADEYIFKIMPNLYCTYPKSGKSQFSKLNFLIFTDFKKRRKVQETEIFSNKGYNSEVDCMPLLSQTRGQQIGRIERPNGL